MLPLFIRDQLLALYSSAVLHPTEWPDVSHELKRKRLGIRATTGGRNWRRTGYRPVITSIIIGIVNSLYNKVDESQAVGDLQWVNDLNQLFNRFD